MLNRSSLTPICPASLSDCLIQHCPPLPDVLLTRIPGGSAISPAENDVEFLRKTSKPGEKQ
jgi:hypothetical protein